MECKNLILTVLVHETVITLCAFVYLCFLPQRHGDTEARRHKKNPKRNYRFVYLANSKIGSILRLEPTTLFLFVILLSGCGIQMDAIQAFEQPMFENGGYNYGQIFYIFEDDIPFVRITGYKNGAYKINLYGKEGWITRRYPYYKPDWQKWQKFARKLKEFEKEARSEKIVKE